MKWLSAGLTFVNGSTVAGLLLGTVAGGLSSGTASWAIVFGVALAVLAFITTRDGNEARTTDTNPNASGANGRRGKYRSIWLWILAACFGFFAFRSFCWLIFIDGNEMKIQSPNNLGDLALHITYIKTFANHVPLWPENPIFVFGRMRYPAGTDLFNALLLLAGVDLIRGLVWAALLASVATFYALYRWSGSFGIAGFLFNGGLAGLDILKTWRFEDYQGVSTIAWKSLALSMFVTQRGVLYALPVGLLLLCHWRGKYFAHGNSGETTRTPAAPLLPFWLEVSLYATMPLFHVHTFMALSIVAAFLFAIGSWMMRKQLAAMVGIAAVPATFFMWTITDHFRARSVLKWQPGWVQAAGEMAMPFFRFWIVNFGILMPLVLLLIAVCVARAVRSRQRFDYKARPDLPFITAAVLIFLFACFVKTAPWEWDNIKLILWAYLIVLPFLWSEVIAGLPAPVRVATCVALFASGFVSLFGGLSAGRPGFGIADRSTVDLVGGSVRKLPISARFASYPTYNHPLLLNGRSVVMGYTGHIWSQGFDYGETEKQLGSLMRGEPNWQENARALGARYLFWGTLEKTNYSGGTQPWEKQTRRVATGSWGAIYDLEAPLIDGQTVGQ